MNRVYYKHILGLIIDDLMKKEEDLGNEIMELASAFEWHDRNDKVDLTKEDTEYINERRQKMVVYHLLICDLEELRAEEK